MKPERPTSSHGSRPDPTRRITRRGIPKKTIPLENRPDEASGFLARHGHKLWWIHSLYAMGLGVFVVTFAQRGYGYARWLTLLLVATWFVLVLTFRVTRSGLKEPTDGRRAQIRFLVVSYVLKNLYQAMLFFLLPWYWKSATADAGNFWFVIVLGLCTLLATLDVIFDRFLMKLRLLASVYYTIALFACLNLALPAMIPLTSAASIILAAAISVVVFWSLHFPLWHLRNRRGLSFLIINVALAVSFAWGARRAIPPVPLSVVTGAVGPEALKDGRLKLEITALHVSMVHQLIGVTDIAVHTDASGELIHVWRQSGRVVIRTRPEISRPQTGLRRLRSTLAAKQLPADTQGDWTLDVETGSQQLVGRIKFRVIR